MKPEELDELGRIHKRVNNNWNAAKTSQVGYLYSSLNQAFPDLLALARDGVRYRWAKENLFIGYVLDDIITSVSDSDIDAAMKERK